MVESMGDPELTAMVRHHHERIDGGGYPDGISRGQIPMGARIISVADTFDALTSARSYRQPRSHEEALGVLREEAGSQLDARAVRAFDGRYSSRRPVALLAAFLGVGRQLGQSMISFGTGASQVAAVGAVAAVIGAAPAVQIDRQQQPQDKQPVVREADAPAGALAAEGAAGSEAASGSAKSGSGAGKRSGRQGKGKDGAGSGNEQNGSGTAVDDDANSSSGNEGGNSGGNTGGGSDDGSAGGSTGGSTDGGSGSSGSGSTASNPVKTLTETVQKPVQQVTQTVTDAIPTLPGDDPVSQTVNGTVGGVKDTLGKLTGKP